MLTDAKTGLCDSCRELKAVAWTDVVGREYCAECTSTLAVPSPNRLMDFLMITIPYRVGDQVRCYTAGALYDGIGTIDEVSFDLANFGTPVHPSFHVKITEPAYPEAPKSLWYTEACLQKAEQGEHDAK